MITIVIVEDQGILRESLACTLNRQRLLHLPECNPEHLLGRFGTQRNRDQYPAIGLRSKNA